MGHSGHYVLSAKTLLTAHFSGSIHRLPKELNRWKKLEMANTSSAKKMIRKIAARTEVNKSRRTRVRTYLRRVEEAIAAGNSENAREALRAAEPELMRAAGKGLFHKKMAARKMSRLSSRIKALSA